MEREMIMLGWFKRKWKIFWFKQKKINRINQEYIDAKNELVAANEKIQRKQNELVNETIKVYSNENKRQKLIENGSSLYYSAKKLDEISECFDNWNPDNLKPNKVANILDLESYVLENEKYEGFLTRLGNVVSHSLCDESEDDKDGN